MTPKPMHFKNPHYKSPNIHNPYARAWPGMIFLLAAPFAAWLLWGALIGVSLLR